MNIEYNHGNHFDGSIFIAPVKGLYSILATAQNRAYSFGYIRCYVNNKEVAYALRHCAYDCAYDSGGTRTGNILLQSTLQLNKNDKMFINLDGSFYALSDKTSTFFECRLVSVIEE